MLEIKGNNYNQKGETGTSASDKERLHQIMRFACRLEFPYGDVMI
jgi:hypothetical protein